MSLVNLSFTPNVMVPHFRHYKRKTQNIPLPPSTTKSITFDPKNGMIWAKMPLIDVHVSENMIKFNCTFS